jgi:4-hydroxy-3-polyprenylbenzoate decarboxylase
LVYQDLADFISHLEGSGQLKRIKAEVDPELEISEIADRVVKAGGPALLFEKAKGSDMPVFINAFGTEERVCTGLAISCLDDLGKMFEQLLTAEPPSTGWEKFRFLWRLKDWAGYLPKRVTRAGCQKVVLREGVSLAKLPILKCWPNDAGRFITLPLVFTKDPDTGRQNCGIYRMQVYDDKTTGMHWHPPKGGAQHFRRHQELGRPMEAAVALGVDPAVTFAAALPAPEGMDEMLMAGLLRQQAVEMVPGVTVSLNVPANAQIVLEGVVDPSESRLEGPFGDHTGYYTLPAQFPVFRIQCITHQLNPIYQATVVGRPPQEDYFLGKAIERATLPLIRLQFPEIKEIHMPFEGAFHNLIIVSIEKRYPGHARKVMHGLWGLFQAAITKVIVVVEQDQNIHDLSVLAFEVLNNIDPERDLEFVLGPVDILDHASRLPMYGSKVGIDATRKWPEEGFTRAWPEKSKMSPPISELVTDRWKEYGF